MMELIGKLTGRYNLYKFDKQAQILRHLYYLKLLLLLLDNTVKFSRHMSIIKLLLQIVITYQVKCL